MNNLLHSDEDELKERSQDAELTLGSGTLFGIFFALVLLCGLCFGMGYAVGRHTAGPGTNATQRPAPDQEPLLSNGSIPKPSAIAQTPVTQSGSPEVSNTSGSVAVSTSASGAAPTPPSDNVAQQTAMVRPALPVSTPADAQSFMVQVAAVQNVEDADVLAGALRKRNYPVNQSRDSSDNLIHVRVGPFANHTIAEQWRAKLESDGYNALIQP